MTGPSQPTTTETNQTSSTHAFHFRAIFTVICCAALWSLRPAFGEDVLVEAEAFQDSGGWTLDAQFVDEMGSPYLLAHGYGKPVDNAKTKVDVVEAGEYRVWVRSKDWVKDWTKDWSEDQIALHHPGRFKVLINGESLDIEFGANRKDWSWHDGGQVQLDSGMVAIELQDLVGFDGRCDAILLTTDDTVPPNANSAAGAWRKRLLGQPDHPVDAGEYDVVVVGGGIAGCASALSAARLGCRVALIQNRPVLGGNASNEVGIGPRGEKGGAGSIVWELSTRRPDGDLRAREILDGERNVSLFLEHHAYDVVMDGNRILAVDARHMPTGADRRFKATVFVDCTGKAAIGVPAGADTRIGREARGEFNEPLAPEKADRMTHGNTVTFSVRMADQPVPFPEVPWALEVAKDYGDLGGQTRKPGAPDWPGPRVGAAIKDEKAKLTSRLTHYWEYGQWLDPYAEHETIRDRLLAAIYGTFSNVKRQEPVRYANLEFGWVAHVPATGEFRRLMGDYVLTENDIRAARDFPDAVANNVGHLCLHYPGHEKYDFRLSDWKWVRVPPYKVPFRCLYSRNITNLMMAGKHISVSHVAGSSTKFMANGGQHGIAVGSAAYLCNKYETNPKGIGKKHINELQDIVFGRGDYETALLKASPKE